MIPTDFKETNVDLPGNVPVRGFCGYDECGACITVAWQPSVEDLKAIAEGRPIFMRITGHQLPEISLFTYDEKGGINT
jgi:hypothetical protein